MVGVRTDIQKRINNYLMLFPYYSVSFRQACLTRLCRRGRVGPTPSGGKEDRRCPETSLGLPTTCGETVEYIHLNPVRRGLVKRPEDWKWSSVHEYAFAALPEARHQPPLRIDGVRIPADERARI